MNWFKINLKDAYEREQDVLSGYSCEQLLLELSCNIPKNKLTKDKIKEHVHSVLKQRLNEAIEIFEANLDNILTEAQNECSE